jgi:DnaJ-class molecular chaperone
LRNPYAILGLTPDADAAEIKAAYRRLAKAYHPDAQGGDGKTDAQAKFQEVTAAYNLLKDKAARTRFDAAEAADAEMRAWTRARRAGGSTESGFEEAPFTRGRNPNPTFEADMESGGDASADIFTGLFGNLRDAGKRVFRARGEDQTYRLTVPFLDAARGGKQRVTLGDGRVLDVKIPAGVEDGQQIRLRGQGGQGYGGAPAGDALINVSVLPHETMSRKGLDILMSLPVSLPEAVLGAKLDVETLTGPVSLTIPPGSNTGTRLRLKERGIALENGSKPGDLYVTLSLSLPDGADQALRDFVSGWGPGLAHDPRQKPRS